MAWLWLVPALLMVLACLPVGLELQVTSIPRWRSVVGVSFAWFFRT
jgi:hypothetical protein